MSLYDVVEDDPRHIELTSSHIKINGNIIVLERTPLSLLPCLPVSDQLVFCPPDPCLVSRGWPVGPGPVSTPGQGVRVTRALSLIIRLSADN